MEIIKERPPRRHVRIRCELQTSTATVEGVSSNISDSGMYVKLAHHPSPSIAPEDIVFVTFHLPEQATPIRAKAQVVWTDSEDHDIGGQLKLGVGLRLFELSPDTRASIQRFIEEFRYSVMVIDPDEDNQRRLRNVLAEDYRISVCQTGRDALALMDRHEFGLLLVGQNLSDMSALDFLRGVVDSLPHSNVIRIVMSDDPGREQLQQFINLGRIFYFVKEPIDVLELKQIVRRAIDAYAMSVENQRLNRELERANRRLRRENSYLRQHIAHHDGFEEIIGESAVLKRMLNELVNICGTDVTVHLAGETGTGKELVARALHRRGLQAKGPFVAQNCGGLSESLLLSTLFGHRRGSFTGADRDSKGVFQQAHGGTLFLDEVAELSTTAQVALLRALQEREVTPVGAVASEKIDVRVISATHKNLEEEVAAGRFREDLYFRLHVVGLSLPALRERDGDVTILAQHFLEKHCARYDKDISGLTAEALELLEAYPWPGNIRELENEVQRMVVLATNGQRLTAELVSHRVRRGQNSRATGTTVSDEHIDQSLEERLRLFETSVIRQALDRGWESHRGSQAVRCGPANIF